MTAHKVTLQMYEDQVQKQGRGRGHGGAQREYQNYQEGRNHAWPLNIGYYQSQTRIHFIHMYRTYKNPDEIDTQLQD